MRWRSGLVLVTAILLASGLSWGADAPKGSSPGKQEKLSAWQWYQEIPLAHPEKETPYYDFVVPPLVFGRAQADLRDLRLYAGPGKEVPFALRLLYEQNRQEPVPIRREFNEVKNADRSVERSLDLGERPGEHNEIVIGLGGNNYRRPFQLFGSDNATDWSQLLPDARDKEPAVIHFAFAGQSIDVSKFRYHVCRFRYLRLVVKPDPRPTGEGRDEPQITSVQVNRSVQIKGEKRTLPCRLEPRDALPVGYDRADGSAWILSMGGCSPPVETLQFDVTEPREFNRTYILEASQSDTPKYGEWSQIASGSWKRDMENPDAPMEIALGSSQRTSSARRYRLLVADYRNPPLQIAGARYTATVRQVLFPADPDLVGPLRLYYGNPRAASAEYDFAKNLQWDLAATPFRLVAEEKSIENPEYVVTLPAKPLSEQWAGLIYTVLSLSSLTLLGILVMLGQKAIQLQEAEKK